MFLFVAFRSRSAASIAYQKLCSAGVVCSLFSTPSATNLGCGLSIKFNQSDLPTVSALCNMGMSCAGFFRATKVNEKIIVTRL